jgi:signal transduction histidine kinase
MRATKRLIHSLLAIGHWTDRCIPENLRHDADSFRRARLITRFGLLGSIFGLFYMAFYLFIGHTYGAMIIAGCTAGTAVTPWVMLWRKSTEPAGHLFALTLTLGFLALCCCEGGIHGHALAWLVSVPLCALLLLGTRAAVLWLGLAFLAASLVVGCDLGGIPLPTTYSPKWEPIVSSAGYLGLVVFMSVLGLIFESGRAKAQARMQAALNELSAKNEQLTALNQEKVEFMGIAAHDLKNPLQVIMSSGEMMQELDDPDQVRSMMTMIVSASQRMHRLITDLLDANAIEEGRYASKIELCDTEPLVMQIVGQNFNAAKKKDIDIRLGVQKSLIASTDPAAAMQILDNLISNAVKYSPRHSTIHVHTMPEKGNALVMVRDEGPGISDEDQKKLFQKYCRLTAQPTGGESSTGLGLSIAKRLAQTLGGDITCYSVLGGGTTFTLRLPLEALKRPEADDGGMAEVLREQAVLASNRN